MRSSSTTRLLARTCLLIALVCALPASAAAAATPWKIALPAAQPGSVLAPGGRDVDRLPAVSCDPAAPLRYYTISPSDYPSPDAVVGYPDQPAGTVPAGQVVESGTVGTSFIQIRRYANGDIYTAPVGTVCQARWVASKAARAAATRAIPQIQVIGRISSSTRTVLRRISQIPAAPRRAFDAYGSLGVLQNVAPLPSIQGWEYLKGSCSLASETSQRSCASLPGLGGTGFGVPGFIGMPARDSYSSFGGVSFHEFGHAIDNTAPGAEVLNLYSTTAAWKGGPFREVKRCWTSSYERSNPGEWFAESFAIRYTSTSKSLWLKRHCPVTWKYHTATFGQGVFDSTIPTPAQQLPGELRTVRLVPKVAAGARRLVSVRASLSARPAAGSRITTTATYRGRLVAKKTWRTSSATSSGRLVARGVPAGGLVRVCVKAGPVGRGVAPIPSWCALARVR